MKILAVYGSPDRGGNSHALAEHVVEGAGKEGAQIDPIFIYDYKVTDVWDNYFGDILQNNFEKAGDDDMQALKEKMLAADIILLVSPVYWYQLSGKMKTFIDRWSDTINPDFSSELGGKGLALVSTHSGLNVMNSSNFLQTALDGTARFLGMKWMGGVDAPIRMPMTSGPNDGHFKVAEDFGRKLARGENLIGQKILED
jgi:multimeric flavodoxin WrbA